MTSPEEQEKCKALDEQPMILTNAEYNNLINRINTLEKTCDNLTNIVNRHEKSIGNISEMLIEYQGKIKSLSSEFKNRMASLKAFIEKL